jgi:GAF domain-containing protein
MNIPSPARRRVGHTARTEFDVLARVRRLAETETDEQAVLDAALKELARELGVSLAKILELDRAGETLRIRAGLGWPPEVIGSETIAASDSTQAGVTLAAGDSVIFDNLEKTSRLSDATLLRRCGVVSSVSAPIGDGDWVYGILSVHTTSPRRFTDRDADLVKSVASLIGSTLAERRRQKPKADDRARDARLTGATWPHLPEHALSPYFDSPAVGTRE